MSGFPRIIENIMDVAIFERTPVVPEHENEDDEKIRLAKETELYSLRAAIITKIWQSERADDEQAALKEFYRKQPELRTSDKGIITPESAQESDFLSLIAAIRSYGASKLLSREASKAPALEHT